MARSQDAQQQFSGKAFLGRNATFATAFVCIRKVGWLLRLGGFAWMEGGLVNGNVVGHCFSSTSCSSSVYIILPTAYSWGKVRNLLAQVIAALLSHIIVCWLAAPHPPPAPVSQDGSVQEDPLDALARG